MSFLFRARWRSGSVVFPYGATPAQAAEIISALGWVQCFWRIGLSLLPYNATPVSAWSPSQQLQNVEFKTARYFFVLYQNQVPRKIQHSGSECNLNSPASLGGAWWLALSQSQKLWLQAGCKKFTQESQGQLTKKSRGLRLRRSP